MKVSDLNIVKDKTYEIMLKRKYVYWNEYAGYNNYRGYWFGLLQIIQCANDGTYLLI